MVDHVSKPSTNPRPSSPQSKAKDFISGPSKSFICSYCHKSLSSHQNLREHEYIHTGHRPYKCKVPGCEASFRQGSQLSLHKKSHLKPEEETRGLEGEIDGLLLPPITLVKVASTIPNVFTIIRC